ncbi:DUF6768 family protein [Pleionea litopenaei]|uniref:Uncharacterized protein n=1 Tax=Pleionea litopenaei TaxID=3070815 RepID=A0AA51RSV7_9GAMM|nr:DUF6768 family protein [Pleionea sp. HL-JVS1]WMS87051.1 hypothetical protein Q9312_17725 [Pleionea sp. HL-JVS1]
MNLDDKIKQALKMDEAEVNKLLAEEGGLFAQLGGVFSGSMKGWNIYGFILSFFIAAAMFWCGYEFFVSTTLDERIFWGVLTIAAAVMTMGIKIWFWMEMSRHSTLREIKRLELAVAQLYAKHSGE